MSTLGRNWTDQRSSSTAIIHSARLLILFPFCAEPKTKTIKETVWDWELLNDVKPVWLRNPKEVPDEDYVKFYQSLTKVTPRPP